MITTRRWGCIAILLLTILSGCSLSPQARRDKYLKLGKSLAEKKDYARAMLAFQNAAQAMPKDAEPYYQLGLTALNSGDIRTGALALKKAVGLDPKHAGAQLKLAELMAHGDDSMAREAEGRLRELIDTAPVTPEMLNSLAYTELRLGKTTDAVQTLEKLLVQNPGELTSSILLARAKLTAGNTKGAEEILQKATVSSPKSAQPHSVLGEFYRDTNRANDAEREFRAALAIDPNNIDALYSLAGVLFTAGRVQEAEATFQRVANVHDTPYPFIYGMFLLRQSRRDDAVREFERIAKANPNDRAARSRMVAAYETVGRTGDAANVLEEALKKNGRDIDALLQRAQLSVVSHKYEDAERDLNKVLQIQPNSAPVHYFLAKVHQARRQDLSYRQDLSKAVELDPLFVQARVELAQNLTASNDPKGALDLLNSAPASQGTLVPIVVQRNWALWALGDMAQMRKGIDGGLAEVRSPDLLLQDALWKLRSGRNPSEARTSLEEALKIDPTDIRALSALEQSYELQKQTAQALEKVKEFAAQEPKSAPVQQFLGTLLFARGDRTGARKAFEAAKQDDPHSVQVDFSLIQADVADGKLNDAQQKLQAVLSSEPTNAKAHLWMSNLAITNGDRQNALAQLRMVIASSPDTPQALNNLAYLLAEDSNQRTEALKYAQKAKELAPDMPAYSDTLGWILYQQGLYTAAIREFESATAKGPDATWEYHLAMAYAKAGDSKRAHTVLETALKQNPKLPEARIAQQVVGTVSQTNQ